MRHVDDGTLHALLDGALRAESPDEAARVETHLDGCDDCRARYEHAAELRSQAAGVLAELDLADAPAEAAPDFQEVLARAQAMGRDAPDQAPESRPGLRHGHRWTRTVSWAATIVLALGAGWMVRDLAGPDGRVPGSTDRMSAPVEMESAEAPVRGESATDAGASDEVVDAEPAGPEPDPTASEPTPSASEAPPVDATPQATRAEDLSVAPASVSSAEAVGGGVRVTGTSGEITRTRDVGVAEGADATLQAAGAATWRTADVEDAEDRLGARLLVLPGAEIVGAEVSGEDSDGGTVRVRTAQLLPGGVQVSVVQSVAAPAAAAGGQVADQPAADRTAEAAPASPSTALEPVQALRLFQAPTVGSGGGVRLDSMLVPIDELRSVEVLRDGVVLTVTGPLRDEVLRLLASVAQPRPAR